MSWNVEYLNDSNVYLLGLFLQAADVLVQKPFPIFFLLTGPVCFIMHYFNNQPFFITPRGNVALNVNLIEGKLDIWIPTKKK